ncbi:thiamine-phosphate kinase [Arthrobacter sp. AET 35A]|uniref:thiamine-phosphate kinase n=1 Tax=Arthrobacter sp. AET 35A TaxID=2292643 RepID=UPI00178236ED|nr:thiamine-phosphate kinase [Arthrobacter sp. AET 35A]MBE0011707.1 thiamine-phosphate kinase [Arthrobacter sp. AET 35A]
MSFTVGGLSESEILQRIFPRLLNAEVAVVGPGDDAAILTAEDGRVVISIDTLVEGQDFRLNRSNGHITSGFDIGWKAAAQNLSDINAMGARATSMVVSLTLPGQTPVDLIEDFVEGLAAAIRELGAAGCGVVGGDLGAGQELAVSIAVTGTLDHREPILRSGAEAGDVVALAGTVGRAAAGLALMESDHLFTRLSPDLQELTLRQQRPRPPLAGGPAAAMAGARSMLDVSDGLVRDAGRIAMASGVSIHIDPLAIERFTQPLLEAAQLLDVDPRDWVLSGGEDYALLATFPPRSVLPGGFTRIGSVSAGEPTVRVGAVSKGPGGWDHFAG